MRSVLLAVSCILMGSGCRANAFWRGGARYRLGLVAAHPVPHGRTEFIPFDSVVVPLTLDAAAGDSVFGSAASAGLEPLGYQANRPISIRGVRQRDDFELVIGGAGEPLLRLHGVVTDSVPAGPGTGSGSAPTRAAGGGQSSYLL